MQNEFWEMPKLAEPRQNPPDETQWVSECNCGNYHCWGKCEGGTFCFVCGFFLEIPF